MCVIIENINNCLSKGFIIANIYERLPPSVRVQKLNVDSGTLALSVIRTCLEIDYVVTGKENIHSFD